MMTCLTRSRQRPRAIARRRGGLSVEMILVVVVLVIATLGIVGFGMFFANAQQVSLASRVGALEASQTANLPAMNGDPVPLNILTAIENQLESSKITYCSVRLEHNATPGQQTVVLTSMTGPCDCAAHVPLSASPGSLIASSRYVRLTVCVPLDEVYPSQISVFGYQLFDPSKTYEHTSLFRYELGTP